MKKNVLLVDDDSMGTTINRMVLERTNLIQSIESVNNGYEALHLLESRLSNELPMPDLLFVDIDMPIMNGFEFLQAINDHPVISQKRLKIIVLSSSIDPRDKERAMSLGIIIYLEKPLQVHVAIELLQ